MRRKPTCFRYGVCYVEPDNSKSAKPEISKCQNFTLDCTLTELEVLDIIKKNLSARQTDIAAETGKTVRSIKWIIDSLQWKRYIHRKGGKRHGKWEALI